MNDDLLGKAIAADMPLSRGTVRELLIREIERRAQAELGLAALTDAINSYSALVRHLTTCATCRRTKPCSDERKLRDVLNDNLARAVAK